MSEWRPIETAPKDETTILVYRPGADDNYILKIGTDNWGYWCNSWAHSARHTQPTHWMPLPEPPK